MSEDAETTTVTMTTEALTSVQISFATHGVSPTPMETTLAVQSTSTGVSVTTTTDEGGGLSFQVSSKDLLKNCYHSQQHKNRQPKVQYAGMEKRVAPKIYLSSL